MGGIFGAISDTLNSIANPKNTYLLDEKQQQGLLDAVDAYQSGVNAAAVNSQQTLQQLLESYNPEQFSQAIRENTIQKANEAQQQLNSSAARKAGSAFNTAAQSAAQRATASAVADINAKAEQQIADYNRVTLSNILDQYGNYTASYQNLIEQLMGGTQKQSPLEGIIRGAAGLVSKIL